MKIIPSFVSSAVSTAIGYIASPLIAATAKIANGVWKPRLPQGSPPPLAPSRVQTRMPFVARSSLQAPELQVKFAALKQAAEEAKEKYARKLDASRFDTPQLQKILHRIYEHLAPLESMRGHANEKSVYQKELSLFEAFIEKLRSPDEAMAKRLRDEAQQKGKDVKSLVEEKIKKAQAALTVIAADDKKVDDKIATSMQRGIEQLPLAIFLLQWSCEILSLKEQGAPTHALEELLLEQTLARDLARDPTLLNARAAARFLVAKHTSTIPGATQPPSRFDRVLGFYAGDDLLKGKGTFLFADTSELAAPLTPEERKAIDADAVRRLVEGAGGAARFSVSSSVFGSSLQPDAKGKIMGYPVVRASIKNGRLEADPQGKIILTTLPVRALVQERDAIDFGERQRFVYHTASTSEGKKMTYLLPQVKEHKKQAEHAEWTPERVLSASYLKATHTLVQNALVQEILSRTPEQSLLSPNDYLSALCYLDAVEASDLALMEGSFVKEAAFISARQFLSATRHAYQRGVIAQARTKDTLELLSKKKPELPPLSAQNSRIAPMEELRTGIVERCINGLRDLREEIVAHPFFRKRFDWFVKQIDCLIEAEEAAKQHQIIPSEDLYVAQTVAGALTSLRTFHKEAATLLLVPSSSKLQEKLHRYLSELPPLEAAIAKICRCLVPGSESREQLARSFDNHLIKLLQDPARLKLPCGNLVAQAEFDQELLHFIWSYMESLETPHLVEFERFENLYRIQKEKGYRGFKREVFGRA
jgi:hypothetical protein